MGLILLPDPAAPPKKPPRPGAPGHLSSLASLGSPGDNYNEGVKVSAQACAQPRTPQSLSLWAMTLRCAVGLGLGGIGGLLGRLQTPLSQDKFTGKLSFLFFSHVIDSRASVRS